MNYNLSSIMSAAWVIARRFIGNGESLRALLRRALKQAWYQAKVAAQMARKAAQRVQVSASQVEAMTYAALAEWAFVIECQDRLSTADHDQLALIRHAMAQRND
ncbi:hypothetical protein QWZ10_03030 [Paracoccus cavernae]|uniref:Uncharacterized protein n=1 Tax=Paracoccus cavernae TaxID=1571207 RepID=A0ABT8D324_9RHOB|nr:hypothetical protein [Paracoccus cavernae]